jgi:hypothetical protein
MKRNWKRLGKQHLLEALFFAVAIIAAATLIIPLWNYNQFYSALYNFSYTIPGVTINTSQLGSDAAQINFTLIATNPTGYSGLQVQGVSCAMYYYNMGTASLEDLTTLYVFRAYRIGPNSNTTILFDTTINPNNAPLDQSDDFQQFISYLISQTPSGRIQWSLTCQLSLASFMIGSTVPANFAPVTTLS